LLDQDTAWFSKHTPKTIDGYVFNNDQHRQLVTGWLENEKIDGNLLLYGAAGKGKTCLSEILIRKIIKTQSDLNRVSSRSVEDIDKLKAWVTKAPNRSKINIVYLEEIDKLSKQAQVTLKEGLMEKHINTTIFIACTNHIKRLDPALPSRFTYKFNLDSFDKQDLAAKISEILKAENAEYDQDQFDNFIELNYQKGLRDILNQLQISYITNNKKIVFNDLIGRTETEDNVIALILSIVRIVLELKDSRQKKQCLLFPNNSIIAKDYINLVTLLTNNWDIDYDQVFESLVENIDLYPAKNIVARFHETYENKKYIHLHLISCLYEVIEACCRAQL
jgi:DNA polymerase III delta prime subunit